MRALQVQGAQEEVKQDDDRPAFWPPPGFGLAEPGQYAWHIATEVACFFSILGALCVLLENLSDHRAGKGTTATRVLMCLMVGSMLAAFGRIWGTLPMPKEYEGYDTYGFQRGNYATCSLQGFTMYLGHFSMMLWDMGLSLYYVLMVCYSWTPVQLWKMERILYAVIWPFAISLPIAAWATQSFNPAGQYCYLIAEPMDCDPFDEECIRGNYYVPFLLVVSFLGLSSIIFSGAAMLTLYCSFQKLEQRNARRFDASLNLSTSSARQSSLVPRQSSLQSSNQQQQQQPSMSVKVAITGILYTGTAFVVAVPTIVVVCLDGFAGYYNATLFAFCDFLFNVHGILYLLIFTRQRKEMKTWCGSQVQRLLKFLYGLFCGGACCRFATRAQKRSPDCSSNEAQASAGLATESDCPSRQNGTGETTESTTGPAPEIGEPEPYQCREVTP